MKLYIYALYSFGEPLNYSIRINIVLDYGMLGLGVAYLQRLTFIWPKNFVYLAFHSRNF